MVPKHETLHKENYLHVTSAIGNPNSSTGWLEILVA